MEIVWLVVRYLGGAGIALAGAWFEHEHTKMKKQKRLSIMRKFDTFTQDVKDDILETFCEYAKKDIADGNFEPDETVQSIATLYGWAFLLIEADFIDIDIIPLVAWHGSKPPRPPKP